MKENQGFTIVEILVSVSLIALLSTMGITGFQSITRGGRDALRKTEIEKIRSSLEIYKSDYGNYPDADAGDTCKAGLPSEYMNEYPNDPKTPDFRYCYAKTTNLTYILCAHLENGDNSELCQPDADCTSNCNYRVDNP